jgi:hypothetical protein
MLMKRTLILNLLELFAGVCVGYLNYELVSLQTASKVTSSIIIGLLTSLLVKSLIESHENESRLNEIKSIYVKISSGLSEKAQDMSNLAKLLRYGTAVFPKEKAVKVWLDLLWLASSRYWSTNYINELWDSTVSELALAIQSAKVRVENVDMRRVFIIDDSHELESLKSVMRAQSNAGVKVRYIFKEEIEKEPYIWKQLSKLDTLDFSLVNSEIIFQVLLDKNRRIRSEQIQIDLKYCKELEEIYSMIFDTSHNFND